MKQKRKRIIITVIVVALFLIFLFYNIKGNIGVSAVNIKILNMDEDADESVEKLKVLYEEEEENPHYLVQHIRKNNIYPSDNLDDYIYVAVFFKLQNMSYLDANQIIGYLDLEDDDSIIIRKDGCIETEYLNSYEKKDIEIMTLDIYRGDKTDEEIVEYIKSLKVDIYYSNKFNKRISKSITLGDYMVTTEVKK